MTDRENTRFNGYVMRGDSPVAEVRNDMLINISPYAPLFLQNRNDFAGWIRDRGADLGRSNMRIILKQFCLPLHDIDTAVRSVNAASVTDSFWIKSYDTNISYNNVQFKTDIYAKAALCGDPDIFLLIKDRTPEITNIGSFNKGWKLKGGEWYLYKTGTALEIFSELFASKLALNLGLDTVSYFIDDEYIVCKNFALPPWDFEPAKSIIGESCDYMHVYSALRALGLHKKYMDLIFMDAVVRNTDRHEFNFGFLTSFSGEIRLAPNFDNNLALFCRGIPSNIERNDPLVNDFIALRANICNEYHLPDLSPQMVEQAFNETIREYPVDIAMDTTIQFCMNAYNKIKNLF